MQVPLLDLRAQYLTIKAEVDAAIAEQLAKAGFDEHLVGVGKAL